MDKVDFPVAVVPVSVNWLLTTLSKAVDLTALPFMAKLAELTAPACKATEPVVMAFTLSMPVRSVACLDTSALVASAILLTARVMSLVA